MRDPLSISAALLVGVAAGFVGGVILLPGAERPPGNDKIKVTSSNYPPPRNENIEVIASPRRRDPAMAKALLDEAERLAASNPQAMAEKLKSAARLDPDNLDALLRAGQIAGKAKRWKLARRFFLAIGADGKTPKSDLHKATSQYWIAHAYQQDGRHAKAVEHKRLELELRRKLAKPADIIIALNNIGYYYGYAKKFEDSARSFREALALSTNSQIPLAVANQHMGLAWTYFGVGKAGAACAQLKDAERIYTATAQPALVKKARVLGSQNKCPA